MSVPADVPALEALVKPVVDLLGSGDDTGCDGLVVVGRKEFLEVREKLHAITGVWHGIINYGDDEDDELTEEEMAIENAKLDALGDDEDDNPFAPGNCGYCGKDNVPVHKQDLGGPNALMLCAGCEAEIKNEARENDGDGK